MVGNRVGLYVRPYLLLKNGYGRIAHESAFELDCGWMVSAGFDPVDYLTKYPDRYRLLHIKDLAKDQAPGGVKTTEVGSGTIDWTKIFNATKKTKVAGYYVEQEPPYEKPPLEAARISYDYLHALKT